VKGGDTGKPEIVEKRGGQYKGNVHRHVRKKSGKRSPTGTGVEGEKGKRPRRGTPPLGSLPKIGTGRNLLHPWGDTKKNPGRRAYTAHKGKRGYPRRWVLTPVKGGVLYKWVKGGARRGWGALQREGILHWWSGGVIEKKAATGGNER